MERKINEKFRYEDLLLKVRTAPKPCLGCHFNAGPGKADCLERRKSVTGKCENREDGATVVFIRLGKVYDRWWAKVLGFLIYVAYLPVFIAGIAVKVVALALLSVGYLLTLDATKSLNVMKSIINIYNYEKRR